MNFSIPDELVRRCQAVAGMSEPRDPDVVTLQEFALATGLSNDAAWQRLTRLVKAGVVWRLKRGHYRLPPALTPPAHPKEP